MASDRDFERRLQDDMRNLPVPPGLEERVVAVAREQVGVDSRTRPRRLRRRLYLLAAAGLLVVGAGSASAYWLTRAPDGPTVPAGPEAQAAIAESEVLARAPWLRQSTARFVQTVPQLRSLRFPPGTTYAEAVTQLTRSVAEKGVLPAGTSLAAPLSAGVVWAPGRTRKGARLDLRAPFGYVIPSGQIRPPSFSFSASLSPEQADRALAALSGRRKMDGPLGPGVRIDAPKLAPCQVATEGEVNRPCLLTAAPTVSE